jgi:hypothetical protein
VGTFMNTLWKPILAGVAIIITIPAIYLPFRLQKVYNRVAALITYKLIGIKIVTTWIIEKREEVIL